MEREESMVKWSCLPSAKLNGHHDGPGISDDKSRHLENEEKTDAIWCAPLRLFIDRPLGYGYSNIHTPGPPPTQTPSNFPTSVCLKKKKKVRERERVACLVLWVMTPRRGPLSTHNVRVCLLFSFASFFKSFYHSFFVLFFRRPLILLLLVSRHEVFFRDGTSYRADTRWLGPALYMYIGEKKKKNRKRQALLARGFLMARHTHETENCWTANTTLFYFPSPYTLILHIFPSSDIKWKI
jgi:hypothetical protein